MNEYETEDQQVEALKKWLKENLSSLIFGLSAGMLALAGWNYYIGQKNTHAAQASDLYMQAVQLIARNGVDEKVIDINNQLNNNFSDSPYASITAMMIASKEYEKDKADEAVSQLEWVVRHAATDELKQIATLRLSRLLIEQKKYDEAMSYLNDREHPLAYDAEYAELKGDIYVAKGQKDEARAAYDKAINLGGGNKWLIYKRDNLGGGSIDATDMAAS